MWLYVLIGIVVVVIIWVIGAQRSLVALDERCDNALSQIGVQQNSRWDALTALAELVDKYSKHEHDTLMDVIAARKSINGKSDVQEVHQQEVAIERALATINALSEAYPELKADRMYEQTMTGVKEYENQVRLSRMVYNDCVTKLNSKVRQLPTSLIAGSFGFTERGYLEENEAKKEMPSFK